MLPTKLNIDRHDRLLELEEKMYWYSGDWKKLWNKEAKQKFDILITDYLTNFPQGCFGLIDKGELVGSIFLLKIAKPKPIPYINKVRDYIDKSGDVAYVSFFVVNKGIGEEEIAKELYKATEQVALAIGCKKIAVTINESPLEEKILQSTGYEKGKKKLQWEIYPGMLVPCFIYLKSITKRPYQLQTRV